MKPSLAAHVRYVPLYCAVSSILAQAHFENVIHAHVLAECPGASKTLASPI